MISLGLRLAVKGGREASARLLFTALGVGLGVALLCFTLAGFNGLKAKDVREGWFGTSLQNRVPSVNESHSDPLWWAMSSDRYDGKAIMRVDVAATGPESPAPPGLGRAPAAGEYYVSPALQDLLARTPGDLLGDRYPGRQTGLIASDALSSPDSLVVIVGHTAADAAALPGALKVRSIETAPRQHSYSSFLKVVLGLGAAGLLIPVLVFVATSTRLAAARREERFAALRLVGATPRQVNVLASVEIGLAAAAGTGLGFLLFWAFRPLIARIPFTGDRFFTTDLSLGWKAILGMALGVPLAAVGAALWSLRRVRVSPLGVSRRVTPKPPRARRLAVLAAALVALGMARFADDSSVFMQFAIIGCFALIAVGIVVAGPWLTLIGARLLARVARRDVTLIAGRRLADGPGTAFRAISGLILAVFIGTVFVGVVGTAISRNDVLNPTVLPRSVLVADLLNGRTVIAGGQPQTGGTGSSGPSGRPLVNRLATLPGVRAVVPIYLPDTSSVGDDIGLVPAADWRRVGVGRVPSATGVVQVQLHGLLHDDPEARPAPSRLLSEGGLADLALGNLLVLNDGRSVTVERVRTAIEAAVPGSTSMTVGEGDAEGYAMIGMLQRMIDVGIILCLVIAGCSLAVSVAGSLIERKRPFSLLRLTGMPLSHLRRVVMLEAVLPLALVTLISAVVGLLTSQLILSAFNGDISLVVPGASYWLLMAAGLFGAVAVVATTLPLLARITEPQTARVE